MFPTPVATFILLWKGSIPANPIYKEEELGSWKGFASLHFIASQGEADPLLEKQNVGAVF